MAISLEQVEMAAEYHRILTSKNENRGAVSRVAEMLKLSESTVYDYLNGRIKIGRRFEHAAFLATGGDPEIKAMLEPEGWRLVPDESARQPSADIEREMGDTHLALGKLHQTLRDGLAGDGRLDRGELQAARRGLQEVLAEAADLGTLLDRAESNHGRLGEDE